MLLLVGTGRQIVQIASRQTQEARGRADVFRYWSILIKVNYCSRLFDVFFLSRWQAEVPYVHFRFEPIRYSSLFLIPHRRSGTMMLS